MSVGQKVKAKSGTIGTITAIDSVSITIAWDRYEGRPVVYRTHMVRLLGLTSI